MLKKLAKYGNSTTLVIDKALLEILNMDESSVVKLQTDGRSLIITPVPRAENQRASYGAEEALQAAHKTRIDTMMYQTNADNARLKDQIPAMQQDFMKAFANHQYATAKFNSLFASKEFQEDLAKIAQQYDPVEQSEDYLKEFNKLIVQCIPEWAELDEELAAINKKYNNI